jgi:hypothetical protein
MPIFFHRNRSNRWNKQHYLQFPKTHKHLTTFLSVAIITPKSPTERSTNLKTMTSRWIWAFFSARFSNDIYYFTYSDLFRKDGIALGFVAVEVWQKPLEIRFVIYQIQPRNLGKLNAGWSILF